MSAEEFNLRTTLKRITPLRSWPAETGERYKGKLDTSEGQPSGTVCIGVLYDS